MRGAVLTKATNFLNVNKGLHFRNLVVKEEYRVTGAGSIGKQNSKRFSRRTLVACGDKYPYYSTSIRGIHGGIVKTHRMALRLR